MKAKDTYFPSGKALLDSPIDPNVNTNALLIDQINFNNIFSWTQSVQISLWHVINMKMTNELYVYFALSTSLFRLAPFQELTWIFLIISFFTIHLMRPRRTHPCRGAALSSLVRGASCLRDPPPPFIYFISLISAGMWVWDTPWSRHCACFVLVFLHSFKKSDFVVVTSQVQEFY